MVDSDDSYDAFDLDENDLAILDQVEAKYIQEASQKRPRSAGSVTFPKRVKTRHNYDDDYDLVDVFVRPDGTYALTTSVNQRLGEEQPKEVQERVLSPVNRQPIPVQRSEAQQSGFKLVQAPRGNIPRASQSNTKYTSTPGNNNTQAYRTVSHKAGNIIPQTKTSIQEDFQKQLAELTARVEELRSENNEFKEALKSAEVARFTKEGEVTILRKKLEKAAQQHTEDLTKLRDSKDAAERERNKLQTDMQEQLERLRTEYIFKQHELESSARKASLSSRAKRIGNGTPFSPIPMPPAMRTWRGAPIPESPTMARTNGAPNPQPKFKVPKTPLRLAAVNNAPNFPGFENSFLPTSPEKSPSRLRSQRTQRTSTVRSPQKVSKLRNVQDCNLLSSAKLSPLSERRQPSIVPEEDIMMVDAIQDFGGDAGLKSTNAMQKQVNSSPSVENFGQENPMDLDLVPGSDPQAEQDTVEGIDWGDELHYLLFTHTFKKTGILAFHYLLSAPVSSGKEYQNACSLILEALGSKPRFSFLKLADHLVEGLIDMVLCLWDGKFDQSSTYLQALFDLLATTMLYIPSFTTVVLRSCDEHPERNKKLVRVLCDIATRSLDNLPSTEEETQAFEDLVHSSLDVLEAMIWTVKDHNTLSLVPIINSPSPLLAFMDKNQPKSVVSHVIRTLVVLSTHSSLANRIAKSTPGLGPGQIAGINDFVRNPLIERVSNVLADRKSFPESSIEDDALSLLNFLSLIISASLENKMAMLQSITVIPCLVHYIWRLSTHIWEYDDYVMQSYDTLERTVRNLKQALLLLHQLVITPASAISGGGVTQSLKNFDLRQKIFHAPFVTFSSYPHMFLVSFGRFSCADPPEWLPQDVQTAVNELTEPARDILDLVIGGPEGDNIWAAYQATGKEDEAVGTTKEDIDEMEARLQMYENDIP